MTTTYKSGIQHEGTFLSLVTEQIMDSVIVIDRDHHIIYVNEAGRKLYGYLPGELLGKTGKSLTAQRITKKHISDIYKAITSGKVWVQEYVNIKKDGSTFICDTKISALTNEQGEFIGQVVIQRDITKRKRAAEELRKAHDELERRVEERTSELVKANKALSQEIDDRRKAEQELEIKTRNLEEVNTALRVLLKRREEDKTELEEKVLHNVKELVEPYLEKLKAGGMPERQKAYVDILESNIKDIISPFLHKLSSRHLNLTPTEIKVANLMRMGMTSKEIGELFNLSSRTISFHRDNIRKKIGIKNKKINLRSHLLSFK